MTPERYTKLNQVLDRRQPDLTLLTDQVHKPRNIAALIRNCDAVGIQQMHAVTPAVSHRPFNGTARGSQQWVDLTMHDSVENGVISLQHQGFKVVAAHWSSRSINYTDWDYTQPTALLLGAERMGGQCTRCRAGGCSCHCSHGRDGCFTECLGCCGHNPARSSASARCKWHV